MNCGFQVVQESVSTDCSLQLSIFTLHLTSIFMNFVATDKNRHVAGRVSFFLSERVAFSHVMHLSGVDGNGSQQA